MDRPATAWRIGVDEIDVTPGCLMGILNITPDSFSDGGDHIESSLAETVGLRMIEHGASIIDVGGESTRPGARAVSVAEELDRVLPVVEGLSRSGAIVSIDTTKPEVAAAAIGLGARIINDVTGFRSPAMIEVAASYRVGVVVMHMKGDPRTMQDDPTYNDVVADVVAFLSAQVENLVAAGVAPDAIVVDPGIGFGKTPIHNLELLNRLPEIAKLGLPVMVGTSRKSTLQFITGEKDPKRRDGQTAVTTALAFERGARVFRVHDVAASRDALSIVAAIVAPHAWEEWQQG